MCVTFGRMLLMLRINPEALGRRKNLDRTSSQDSTRCESCLATKHEILSAGRWFIILLLQLGGNGNIETLRKGNEYRSIFPPSPLPINSWTFSRDWLFFSFCYCFDMILWRGAKMRTFESTLSLNSSLGQWSMLMLSFAWVSKISPLLMSGTFTQFDNIATVLLSCSQQWGGGTDISFSGLGKKITCLSEFDQFQISTGH